jgi:hypothetical protein
MVKVNRFVSFAAAAALAVGSAATSSVASARASSGQAAPAEGSAADQAPQAYEPVDSFVIFNHPYSWNAVDDHTVVIWTNPFTPYLVELAFPSHDMKFVQAIGVSSSGSRVYAKFDAVTIRGFRYPINNIYKLSRDEAKNLTSRKPGNS